MLSGQKEAVELIESSCLPAEMKLAYIDKYQERLRRLK